MKIVMNDSTIVFIAICSIVLLFFIIISELNSVNNLNGIKSKNVGDGQHGTARFANRSEIHRAFKTIDFEPDKWRMNVNRPKTQGIVVGCEGNKRTKALVDDTDVHALMIGAAGVGKTAFFLYPNIEYACASGMSFLTTDTKGDLYRNYAEIARKYYGYNISILDLRNPTQSNGYNLLDLVNKYMDKFKENNDIKEKAKSEKYAKIIAKTIINSGGESQNMGQNAFFYDSAEGLLTSSILLVAEFGKPGTRHIISVFKLIQDLLEPAKNSKDTKFKELLNLLPQEHKARWFAGSALNTAPQTMQSVLSTALARLNAFLDSELEQIICFDTAIDAESFCNQKSAIFIIMPEEDNSKYFFVSLVVQQLYREILSVADETDGKLKNRVMFYLDEIGTIPKIDSAEMMFSASRSRRLSIVAIIQSLAQLEKNYGKEGAEIIQDNCQITIFGGFAPNSKTAEVMSKNMGERTVMSGSVNKSKDSSSKSLQMMARPLMSVDELKSMKKGNFIVMKTGSNPIKAKYKLFLEWGIKFEDQYDLKKNETKKVLYINEEDIRLSIENKYKRNKDNSQPKKNHYPGTGVIWKE
jgi:type IV secretion system protein VirD4